MPQIPLFQQALSSIPAGAFSLKNAKVKLGVQGRGFNAQGALIQRITFNFGQQTNNVGELGSENFYYAIGRRNGTGTIQQFFGPTPVVLQVLETYTDPCKVIQPNLAPPWSIEYTNVAQCINQNAGNLGNVSKINITLSGLLLTSVQVDMASENPFMSLNAQFQFADMTIDYS